MSYQLKKVLLSLTATSLIIASMVFVMMTTLHAKAASTQLALSATDYYTPGQDPWGTAFDSSGRVWVALPGCDFAPNCPGNTPAGKIALFDPVSHYWPMTVALPSGYGQPAFVAVDHSGNVWFTMPVTNTLAVYHPGTNTLSSWNVPTTGAGPWDLAIDSKGIIWFTEHYSNKIGSFDPSSNTFHEVATPASNSNPYGITIDASDNIWFTENTDSVALIGEYSQGTLKEYKIRNSATTGTGLTPHMISVDPNGNVWWSEGWVSSIAELKIASAQPGTNNGVTEYHYTPSCANCGSHTSGISVGKQGYVWLDDSLQNTYGSFPLNASSGFTFYNAPSGGHPHDGLNIDGQNNVWFNEEFANKLAEASASANTTPTATTAPTATATATTVPTATAIATATATSTPATGTPTPLAQDSFQRPNQSHWGAASNGQTWSGDANTVSAFSIVNNAGHIANTSNSYSAVLGTTATNAEVFMNASISSFANNNFGAVLRWTDGNNWYKAYIDGSNLIIQKKVGGTSTTLKSVPFAAQAGTSYTIHFRVVGSTLYANVWASAGSEPAGWMATATDSSLASGYCGMRFLPQGATITVTSFLAQ